MRLWIVANEVNEDIPARSFYFESGNRIGKFSGPFTKQVETVMIESLKARRLQRTGRG